MERKIKIIALLLMGALLCSACSMARSDGFTAGKSRNSSATANAAGQEEEQSTADLPKTKDYYMIVKNDIQNYQMTLMELSNGEQICYEYTDGTEFFDKYGDYELSQEFSEGKLVEVQRRNSNDTLGAVAFTDGTWEYEGVRNYTVNTEKERIDIADTGYQLAMRLKVFSEGEESDLFAVGDSDILNVYGIGRTVYAIVVETGHGTLALANTELFEGGWVNLGTKVYAKVTKDMTMELPEGIYEFSVANDGYGDSGEIRIRRDKTTTIDLNDYKGEGPKLCKVTFDVGVAGAILTINGKKVNHKEPMELRYGVYKLGVYAEGYDAWEKQLVVNSPKSKIEILLSDGAGEAQVASNSGSSKNSDTKNKDTQTDSNKTASNKTASSQTGSGSKAGSKAGSYTRGSSSGQSGSSNSSNSALVNAALGSSLASIITGGKSTDYLDTLSDLVDSLDRLNKSKSSSNGQDGSDE